ncbi:MAG: RidA family protein [Rhizobiaceae bacterium]
MERINAENVTPYRNPISHAVRTGNLVFLSGITPFKGDREIAREDFPAQLRQVLANIAEILAAAGSRMDLMVKTTVYLRRKQDFAAMNDISREAFTAGFPARTTIITELSHPDFLVQIDGVAECVT